MALRGRPRKFDRPLALQQAMEIFWAKGYEGAQLNDLTAAMGINPPSFYAAFGSKEKIFREAVALYVATIGSGTIMKGLVEGETVCTAIRAMLMASVDVALGAPQSSGCLLILGVVNCLPENESMRDLLREIRQETADCICKRLERGVREGDLPATVDIRRLTTFFGAIMQALSLQARDGATRDDLVNIVASAMTVLQVECVEMK